MFGVKHEVLGYMLHEHLVRFKICLVWEVVWVEHVFAVVSHFSCEDNSHKVGLRLRNHPVE